jgi:hypothetical protein
MSVHFRERKQFLCGVTKPRNSATWITFFRVALDQRCPDCMRIWRERNGGSNAPAPVAQFNYEAWALEICAGLLDYDLGSINFEAVGLPDVKAGRDAIKKIITRLREEAKASGGTIND